MLINLRNALMAGKRLPYDAEVEFLESTGTQYIDTGVRANQTTSARLLAAFTEIGNDKTFFSVDNGTTYTAAFSLNTWNGLRFVRGTVNTLAFKISANTIYDISCGPTGMDCNGTHYTIGTTADFETVGTIPLCAWNRNGSILIKSKCRIYSAKFYQNDVLVRDYISVRKGTVGYLYDRVSGKLFGNAGTGDFVVGQDVVPMTWQDGLQYNNVGTPVESATSSIGLDYIPITAGHSFTWRLGYGSSASADLIIYNANKERIDYWVARDRTVTISGAAAYMRISALTSYKEQATVYDETAQKYVFANGRIPIPAE